MTEQLASYTDTLLPLVREAVKCAPASWNDGQLIITCDGAHLRYALKNSDSPDQAQISDTLRAQCEEFYVRMRQGGDTWDEAVVKFGRRDGSWKYGVKFKRSESTERQHVAASDAANAGDYGAAPPKTSVVEEEEPENTSGKGKFYPAPAAVTGWSWGGFCLSWIWALGNGVPLGLLGIIPGIGLILRIVLGINGREWAWQNKRWDSIDHFNAVQRRWTQWGVGVFIFVTIGGVSSTAIPRYERMRIQPKLDAAMAYANAAAEAVGRYVSAHHALPTLIQQTGFTRPLPEGVESVTLDRHSGQLRVTLDVGAAKGQAFILAPFIESTGEVTWRCLHGEVARSLLPDECKYDTPDPFRLP